MAERTTTAHSEAILRIRNVKTHFPIRAGILQRIVGHVRAVDGVSFDVRQGETVGLVGESGCGKTTLARTIIRLLDPTAGSIEYRPARPPSDERLAAAVGDDGMMDISHLSWRSLRSIRPEVQYIFQDPYSSLNARMTIEGIMSEPMAVAGMGTAAERRDRAGRMLERVGLNRRMLQRYPNEFSGGQRQRIVVGRALMLEPRVVICDEPVSALDVSVQAQVLNLLKELQGEFGFTYLFIAHDLSVVDYMSDRIFVMYLGQIVEQGTPDELYAHPKHPYTEALMASIPTPDPRARKRDVPPRGGVPNPAAPPPGCRFHPRCPYALDACRQEAPVLREVEGTGQTSACLRVGELALRGYEDLRVRDEVGASTERSRESRPAQDLG